MKFSKKEKELFEAFMEGFKITNQGFNFEFTFNNNIENLKSKENMILLLKFNDFISKVRMRKE